MPKYARVSVWAVRRGQWKSLLGDAPVPSEVAKKIKNEVKGTSDVKKRQEPYTTPVTEETLRYTIV